MQRVQKRRGERLEAKPARRTAVFGNGGEAEKRLYLGRHLDRLLGLGVTQTDQQSAVWRAALRARSLDSRKLQTDALTVASFNNLFLFLLCVPLGEKKNSILDAKQERVLKKKTFRGLNLWHQLTSRRLGNLGF